MPVWFGRTQFSIAISVPSSGILAWVLGPALVVGEEGGDGLLHGADAPRLQAGDPLQRVAEVAPLRARDAQQRRVLPHLCPGQGRPSKKGPQGVTRGESHLMFLVSKEPAAVLPKHCNVTQ